MIRKRNLEALHSVGASNRRESTMLAASMIWGCRSLGDWLQAADLRGASGSLGGEVVGRLHGEPCACGSHAGLFEADSEVGADSGMTVQHAAQRHTRDAEP